LKISLNPDHSSRGYGFICFNEEDSASKAVDLTKDEAEVNALKFEPKDRRSFKKLKNNIYVKNIPRDMADADVRKLFEAFGNIKSLIL
jgi:RNA recognition motif-containing protein